MQRQKGTVRNEQYHQRNDDKRIGNEREKADTKIAPTEEKDTPQRVRKQDHHEQTKGSGDRWTRCASVGDTGGQ